MLNESKNHMDQYGQYWNTKEKQMNNWLSGFTDEYQNATPTISFTIGKRDRKKIPLTCSITVNNRPCTFSGECPVIFGSDKHPYKNADRYYVQLRHYIGVDDKIKAEATEELSQENGAEIMVKFTQGTSRFMLNHSVTRREKSTSWQIKDTRRIRMWLELSFCKNSTIICVSNKEEIVFRNGNTKEELDVADSDIQESDTKRFRSDSPNFSSSSSYESEPIDNPPPMGTSGDVNHSLPPTTNFFPPPTSDGNMYPYGEKNNFAMPTNRGYQITPSSSRERVSSPNPQGGKIDIHPEEKEIFLLYRKLEGKHMLSSYNDPFRFTRVCLAMSDALRAKMSDEQLEIAVNYLDRFLMQTENISMLPWSLDVLPAVCVFLASKTGENVVTYPTLEQFLADCINISHEMFLDIKNLIVKSIGSFSRPPTSRYFLKRMIQVTNAENNVVIWANFLCDIAMMDGTTLKYKPSILASSAFVVAHQIIYNHEIWPPILEQLTDYRKSDLKECIYILSSSYVAAMNTFLRDNKSILRLKYAPLIPYFEMYLTPHNNNDYRANADVYNLHKNSNVPYPPL